MPVGNDKRGTLDEQAFRIRAMRDRRLGLWAAKELGLDGGNAIAYAAEVTNADAEHGEGAMIRKIITDLIREEVAVQPETVERLLHRYENEVRKRIGQTH